MVTAMVMAMVTDTLTGRGTVTVTATGMDIALTAATGMAAAGGVTASAHAGAWFRAATSGFVANYFLFATGRALASAGALFAVNLAHGAHRSA